MYSAMPSNRRPTGRKVEKALRCRGFSASAWTARQLELGFGTSSAPRSWTELVSTTNRPLILPPSEASPRSFDAIQPKTAPDSLTRRLFPGGYPVAIELGALDQLFHFGQDGEIYAATVLRSGRINFLSFALTP